MPRRKRPSEAARFLARMAETDGLHRIVDNPHDGDRTAGSDGPGHTKKLFISYARSDRDAARRLWGSLHAHGFDVWFDEESLLPGQDWEFEIEEALQRSDAVLVLLSQNSIDKVGYVQREIVLALNHADRRPEGQVFIIPVLLDGSALPRRLSRWHAIDTRTHGWFERLTRALGAGGQAT